MLSWQRDVAVDVKKAQSMSQEELAGKMVIGELSKDESKEEYTDMYLDIIEKVGGGK